MELAFNQPVPLLKRLSWFDWLFAAIVATGALLPCRASVISWTSMKKPSCWRRFRAGSVRLVLETVPPAVHRGRRDQSVRRQPVSGQPGAHGRSLFLKYLISSQAAIMWMCALFGLATLSYWGACWRVPNSP